MTTNDTTADVIDKVLGLAPSSPLLALREQRAKLKHLTQTSYVAALHPTEPRNFSYAERAALAGRMAGLWNSAELAAHYRELAEKEEATSDTLSIIDATWRPADESGRLFAILRHVDLVTKNPREATRANIDKLYSAGLDDRDIVTLAGIIAFVNYQVLVIAGLTMLRDN